MERGLNIFQANIVFQSAVFCKYYILTIIPKQLKPQKRLGFM